MDKQDIPFLTAARLSDLVRAREVSPVEALEAYLDRIDDQDFRYNAYLTVCRERAVAEARQAQEEIARGNYLGPMHGIPVAVKDQLWTRGVRSTGGCRFLADSVPSEDATIVANLGRAGAVLLGKTNMTELAITGYAHQYSTPRNPWDLDMYTGGSSSGSAAATGAFLCATSLGEDTGGVHPLAVELVRPVGAEADVGKGQPLRGHVRLLVDGHLRSHVPVGGGRGHDPHRHRGP